MPINISYICDKCNESVGEETDLWQMEVMMRKLKGGRPQTNRRPLTAQGPGVSYVYWCEKCVDKTGLTKQADPEAAAPTTLESLVEEIAREVVEERLSEGP